MNSKNVWGLLVDILRNPKIPEAMFCSVFFILCINNEELGDDQKIWKARCVFQGSNVRTKTGTSAVELLEETRNAPASFAATRAALGVAAMRGFNASLRDADKTYLQAVIDSPTRTPTFVGLPREWWPNSWFVDGALRQVPKHD